MYIIKKKRMFALLFFMISVLVISNLYAQKIAKRMQQLLDENNDLCSSNAEVANNIAFRDLQFKEINIYIINGKTQVIKFEKWKIKILSLKLMLPTKGIKKAIKNHVDLMNSTTLDIACHYAFGDQPELGIKILALLDKYHPRLVYSAPKMGMTPVKKILEIAKDESAKLKPENKKLIKSLLYQWDWMRKKYSP